MNEHSTFIIAEAGINHNGDITIAKKLADSAKECGADAVKYQTFYSHEKLKQYELTREEFITLKQYCDSLGIEFMTTAHEYSIIDFVDSLVLKHKVASPFLTNHEFLKKINKCRKPVYLSTGSLEHKNKIATMNEIWNALNTLNDCNVTLLHCVSSYPCKNPMYERIHELKTFGVPVGLSDHSKELPPLNLPVIEKHFMLEGSDCIDKSVSLTPNEFKKIVKKVRSQE